MANMGQNEIFLTTFHVEPSIPNFTKNVFNIFIDETSGQANMTSLPMRYLMQFVQRMHKS
jgi:hypothetical protein